METGINLPEPVEYVDAICLDKGIILPDGCTTATITTVDGEPVTFIVSQPLVENENCTRSEEEIITADDASSRNDNELNLQERDNRPTIYTVHYPNDVQQEETNYLEQQEHDILEESKTVINQENSVEHEILVSQPDIESLTPVSRLEDFMDVVTTYKCKFCRFSCPWKSGLMSHIRCCHIKEKNCIVTLKSENKTKTESLDSTRNDELATVSKDTDSSEKVANVKENESCKEDNIEESITVMNSEKVDAGNESSSSPNSPLNERHIFLCGQCSDGFASLEECKQHMIDDHNLRLAQDNEKPLRKRGRPRTRQKKDDSNQQKKKIRKETSPKESKKKRTTLFKNLEDELDCCIKRKLRTGYVNDRAFRCTRSGCGHRFTSDSNLNYHYNCHSSGAKQFTCPECREEFDNWRGLAMHLWREHTVDIDLHSCTECSYKTFSFFKLDNHRKIHSEERAYVCDTCGKGFKQISQLRNHVVIHLDRKNLPEKRWYSEQECDICGRKFSDTKCLRKHQQAVHSKLKPYICSYCGHLSARKAMLELHMRQHTGEKPFLCEHCDYRTGDHNSLRRHRMRHTGDKPYKCPHCPYACIQAISYKTHLRNKHPGLGGLYSCNICSFKSVSKENFLNHMSDHKRLSENLDQTTTNLSQAEPEIQLESISSDQSSVQMQLTDNALQQLEGILPGNITAAQLIYSCLNAMSQDGSTVNLPPGVTVNIPQSASTSSDGTQTITIQLPTSQEMENEPYYFTIQQQDGTTALVLPSDQNTENVQEAADMEGVHLTDQDISSAAASLNCNVLAEEDGAQLQGENADLVIAHIESLTDSNNFNEMITGTEIRLQSS
ncbi:zinc finger protein 782-like [Argiope bruennichi]|uniref:Zinc finger protein 782 like protein n=1 Tax=Argiope bruennichi TaxID=94029 RepID=A0A8T0EWA4_ARGBR|nr:zinc finger protein 782-like [Argiope bruennichi]XP_055932184.1 zinc finger protein 782-like [Argiope bruennichi]XP_055932186.1 zinc finger protein 782-like [Argiope bruennichi]XP_055932187.1 zinc finger protein 782-like [Argiope bruennichi]KAF8782616.1 Zinc finger protein 782 like protein [Argiope bruennichi]